MKLHTINTGYFKLDGGAMFGVVPKTIWNKINPSDENNMCNWAMRCLLVEDGDRLILIDNGIGNKQEEKFFGHYYLSGNETLVGSIKKAGFEPADITDMFLTHLHFDHCGGGIVWNKDRTGYEPLFKNARYWSHQIHWNNAMHPNVRERASFLKENLLPMQESGQLRLLDKETSLNENFSFRLVNGHTEGMMIPLVKYKDRQIAYVADLIPSMGHIPVPYVMSYDVRPLECMEEKTSFLKEAAANGYILFFEHDPVNECCTVAHTEKGVRAKEIFRVNEI
jgi:glyoxylase-like metal-dependent hydrolase (beta-lactamase superfamily II)